jgi:hypothetical protein
MYVDVDRARSMLAQLDGGVVENVVQKSKSALKGAAVAKLLGIGASGDVTRETGSDESRSMKDLTYVLFEEVAEAEGLITDASEIIREATAWESSEVHGSLVEGQILRLTCDIQILDPSFFRARLNRVDAFVRAVAEMQVGSAANLSKGQREKRVVNAMTNLLQNTDPQTIARLVNTASPILGESIAVRTLPCGQEQSEFSFGGVLLNRAGYIQQEREDLFSRHGTLLRHWTIVMQVANIAPKPDDDTPTLSVGTHNLLSSSQRIQRAALEKMVVDLLGVLESFGFSEGPRWPSITVTPLAIYRWVPQMNGTVNHLTTNRPVG